MWHSDTSELSFCPMLYSRVPPTAWPDRSLGTNCQLQKPHPPIEALFMQGFLAEKEGHHRCRLRKCARRRALGWRRHACRYKLALRRRHPRQKAVLGAAACNSERPQTGSLPQTSRCRQAWGAADRTAQEWLGSLPEGASPATRSSHPGHKRICSKGDAADALRAALQALYVVHESLVWSYTSFAGLGTASIMYRYASSEVSVDCSDVAIAKGETQSACARRRPSRCCAIHRPSRHRGERAPQALPRKGQVREQGAARDCHSQVEDRSENHRICTKEGAKKGSATGRYAAA